MLFQFYNSYHSNNHMHVFSVQEWTLFFSVLLIFGSQMKLELWLVVHHLMIGCSMHTRWEARVYPSTYTTDTARNDKSTLVEVMACCCQGTSHYLKQCWPSSISYKETSWQHTDIWSHPGHYPVNPCTSPWSPKVMVMNDWLISLLLNVNWPSYSLDMAISKFDLENPRSMSWPRSNPMNRFVA